MKEIRYPSKEIEMKFTVSSVGDKFEPYVLIVATMHDLQNWLLKEHSGEWEILIDFEDMRFRVHDDYLY